MARIRAWWSDFLDLMDEEVTTKRKHLIGTCAVAFAVVGMVFNLLQNNSQRDAERARDDSLRGAYVAQLSAHRTSQALYAACLDRVAARDDSRFVFYGNNDTLRNLLLVIQTESQTPDSPLFDALFEQLSLDRDSIDERLPQENPARCVDPGNPPGPPESIAHEF